MTVVVFFLHPPAEKPDWIQFTCDAIHGGGECRRHPPVKEEEFRSAVFPIVGCDWWCGEFVLADERVVA